MDKALISYKVDCLYVTFRLTDKDKEEIASICQKYEVHFFQVIEAILSKELHNIGDGLEWLYGLLERDWLTSKVFEGENPIEQRRAAIRYANSLNEVIQDSEVFYSYLKVYNSIKCYGLMPVLHCCTQNEKLNIHNVTVYMVHAGVDYQVGSQFENVAIEMATQAAECFLYQFYNYDTGGEPVKRKLPGTALDMWYLPEGKG